MAEDMGEKTEQPTAKRRGDARNRGEVARSEDFGAVVSMIVSIVLLVIFGGVLMSTMGGIFRRVLTGEAGSLIHASALAGTVQWVAMRALWIAAPLMLILAAAAAVAHVSQIGFLFTTEPLKPRLDRLNPAAGMKRIFSLRGVVKSAVNTLKLAVAVLIAALVGMRHMEAITALPRLAFAPAMYKTSLICLEMAAWLLLVLLVLAVIDLIYQRWQHTQDLKMTTHEVKDERRSVDGDPDVKKRRMRMAQEIAMQRMQASVPEADVVVTNPTHVAVAIAYDAAVMRAPRVTAKGADFMAIRIRQIAQRAGVQIVERPPLARALYHATEVGSEIAPEHYEAVAEILAYVYRLEGRAA